MTSTSASVEVAIVQPPATRTLYYRQCTPCFRYRARCQAARPCLRCLERNQEERCVDVGPPCLPCSEGKLYCDRRRPCKRCKDRAGEGATVEGCVDGPPDELRTEVVELGPDGEPIVPERPEPVPRAATAAVGKAPPRRLTEGQKLQAEMEASEAKRRRSAPNMRDGEGDEDAHGADHRGEEPVRAAVHRPYPTHDHLPLLPPPPARPPLLRLRVQWPDPAEAPDGRAALGDEAMVDADDAVFIDSVKGDEADPPSWPPHFRSDLSHLIPRPPLLPLSGSPVAFLNLWAHFMHVQRRPITGHHVLLQQRSVTAWDVYRVVTEHGGYHHVLAQRSFHSVLSAICHSSPPAAAQALATQLPGGPAVTVSALRPRTFLIDYYERFLYAFELAYQWEKGHAPGTVPLPGRSVASMVEGKRKRRKGAGAVKVDLLKRLWAPTFHTALFKDREKEDDAALIRERDEDELGYVGVTRLKRSLGSGVTEEVTAAINRLLRLSWTAASKAGPWDEDDADDDEDGSDVCLLFHHDVISDLLDLLLYPPLHAPHLSHLSPSPVFTPLLVHEHLQNVASSSPDFHSAALIILHNLSSQPSNRHRFAAHTTALNVLAHIVVAPRAALLHVDVDEGWTLSLKTLTHCMPAVNLTHVVRRTELVRAMTSVLQGFLDHALFPDVDRDAADDAEDVEVVAAVLGGFIGLVTNPQHAANIPFLLGVLPSAFFSLLLSLASPLMAVLQVRHLAVHALTFYALSHRTFASRLVHARGLPVLLSFLTTPKPKSGTEAESEREMCRATAATVQAIASYCTVAGGAEAAREGLQWEMLWRHEAELFTACCLDPDVAALLVPALQRSGSTRMQAEKAAEAALLAHPKR